MTSSVKQRRSLTKIELNTSTSLNLFFFPHFMSLTTSISLLLVSLLSRIFSFPSHTFHFINFYSSFKDTDQAPYPPGRCFELRAPKLYQVTVSSGNVVIIQVLEVHFHLFSFRRPKEKLRDLHFFLF